MDFTKSKLKLTKSKFNNKKLFINTNYFQNLPSITEKVSFQSSSFLRNSINISNSTKKTKNSTSFNEIIINNSKQKKNFKSYRHSLDLKSGLELMSALKPKSDFKSKENSLKKSNSNIKKNIINNNKGNLTTLIKCKNINSNYIESMISRKKIKNEFYIPYCSITECYKDKKYIKMQQKKIKERNIFNKVRESFYLINNEFIRKNIKLSTQEDKSCENIFKKSNSHKDFKRIQTEKNNKRKNKKLTFRKENFLSIDKNRKLILSNINQGRLSGYEKIINKFKPRQSQSLKPKTKTKNTINRGSMMATFLLKLERPDEILEDYIASSNRPIDKYKRFKLQLLKKEKYLTKLTNKIKETQNNMEMEIKKFNTRLKCIFMRIGKKTNKDIFGLMYKTKKIKK